MTEPEASLSLSHTHTCARAHRQTHTHTHTQQACCTGFVFFVFVFFVVVVFTSPVVWARELTQVTACLSCLHKSTNQTKAKPMAALWCVCLSVCVCFCMCVRVRVCVCESKSKSERDCVGACVICPFRSSQARYHKHCTLTNLDNVVLEKPHLPSHPLCTSQAVSREEDWSVSL